MQQYDQVTEQTVVGAMLLDRKAIWTALETLWSADFYQPKHEVIARAAVALAEREEPWAASRTVDRTAAATAAYERLDRPTPG